MALIRVAHGGGSRPAPRRPLDGVLRVARRPKSVMPQIEMPVRAGWFQPMIQDAFVDVR